jgi:nitrite reductase/ring-hydroxylating ferredoxin subunit
VPGVALVPRAPLPSFDTGPCLRFPDQGRFEPIRYLEGLARAFERRGGRLFTGTHATSVAGGTAARVVTATGHVVSCAEVVVATNTPVNDRFVIHTKQAPYATYAIAARVPRGSLPDVLLWDTEDPYHYVRLQRSPDDGGGVDLLIVGGEDHKTGQASDGEQRLARLEDWARERFPMAEEVAFRWTGQVMEPTDGLAFIGRNPTDAANVYVATGDSGHGMTHGTIAAILLADLIAGRPNPWAALYDPARVRLGSATDLLAENLNVAAQYVEWLRGGDASSEAEIPRGAGAVLRRGLGKVAVYRDEGGRLHRMTAICPHLGCIVAWNAVDRTWDCPCHGSRFACTGEVINGPANDGLAAVNGDTDGVEREERHGEQEQV